LLEAGAFTAAAPCDPDRLEEKDSSRERYAL
jgi:hypothetical protein